MADRIEKRSEFSKDRSSFVWVEVPAKDIYDFEFPTIRINTLEFPAGGRYFVPPEVGEEMLAMIGRIEKGLRRLMNPKPDSRAQHIADGQSASELPSGGF